MTLDRLVTLTRERLGGRARREVARGALVPAAVLVPLVDRREPCLVFVKRTDLVGHHKGQISFPGGSVDPGDRSFLETALRECEEEIGLPRGVVEPLGMLDDTETVATHFVITPLVGLVSQPVAWRPDGREIEKVLEVPWSALTDPRSFRVEWWERAGGRRPVYFYDWQGETIWGATARILKHYIEVVTGEWTEH
jgi:8-oxo-dGTP pyrophosphatase MutT (NUDIX family)